MYNVMEKQTDSKVCHAQVVYLAKVLNKSYEEISEITSYAISTIKNYIRKFSDLLEWAKEIFESVIPKRRKHKYDDMIINNTNYDIYNDEIVEKCYLFKFLDAEGQLIYSKVGTAARQSIYKRLSQEIRSYRKSGYDIQLVEVDRVWNCGDLPAEGLESLIRSEYIKKYPKSFKKNDRFLGEFFDLSKCDKIAEDYLGIA